MTHQPEVAPRSHGEMDPFLHATLQQGGIRFHPDLTLEEVMALAAVVLPIPISPVPMSVWPCFLAKSASPIPIPSAE